MCCQLQAKGEALPDLHAREEAVNKAAQQLLAEEDQDAAKAAAKAAKKLRQKLKKQQQAKDKQLSKESLDATAATVGSCNGIVSWQDANRAINESSACLEPSMQGSDAQQLESESSVTQHPLRQASAAEHQVAESVPTQDSAVQTSGFVVSAAQQTDQKVSPAEDSSALLSLAQSSSPQKAVHPRPAEGSPGALYKLLCCPLIKVAFD